MAYQTGSETSTSGLISAIHTFAIANAGFVHAGAWVYGGLQHYALFKDGEYFIFRAQADRIDMMLATDINTAASLTAQPGGSAYPTTVFPLTPPYTSYHLFANSSCVRVAVECSPGRYNHLAFGHVVKTGEWTGGGFVTGQYYGPSGYGSYTSGYNSRLLDGGNNSSYGSSSPSNKSLLRVHHNGKTLAQFSNGTRTGHARVVCPTMYAPMGYVLLDNSPNLFNMRSAMPPAIIYLWDELLSAYRPLGYVDGIRAVNILNLNPKDTVNGDWMVFPLGEKNGSANGWPNTADIGVAFQK